MVVLAYAEYRRMTPSRKKLSEFFRESPPADAGVEITRDRSVLEVDIPF